MNFTISLLPFIIFLIITRVQGIFEWVHPDEWQHRQPIQYHQDGSFGEKIKSKASQGAEVVKEKAEQFKEAAVNVGKGIKETASNASNHDTEEAPQTLQKKRREDIFEPIVKLMNHALGLFEEDISPAKRKATGWPSRFETNPRLWREYPEEYLLFLDIPGIPKSDISVNVSSHYLSINGRHGSCIRPAKAKQGKEVDRLCMERAVSERIKLPEDVNPDGVECKFKEGMLIVRMPKLMGVEKKVRVEDYVPSWSEMAKEAKEKVMGKMGFHHDEADDMQNIDVYG